MAKSYGVSNPTFWPIAVLLAVAYATFLVIMLLRGSLDEWLILVPTLPLLPLAYVLHRSSLSWIRIKNDEIEVVPSWFRRKFWGDQGKNARFDADCELLFCERFAYRAFDGYSILLRSRSGPDLALWSTDSNSTGVGLRWWSEIAREITDTFRLRTRLVEQRVGSQPTQEVDWVAGTGRKLWRLKVLILPGIAPWLGLGARLLTADSLKLSAVGILLWLASVGLVLYRIRSRTGAVRGRGLVPGLLVFTLQFVTFYTLTVLVAGAVLRR